MKSKLRLMNKQVKGKLRDETLHEFHWVYQQNNLSVHQNACKDEDKGPNFSLLFCIYVFEDAG